MEKMTISNLFLDAEKVIRERIENMAVTGCINNYIDYMDSSSSESFEREYINALYNHYPAFFEKVIKKDLEDKTADELRKLIADLKWDGAWGIHERDLDEQKEWFEDNFTDGDLYDFIKDEMVTVLNTLIENKKRTKRDIELETLKVQLETVIDNAEYHKKLKEKNEKEFEEIKQKIFDLESQA